MKRSLFILGMLGFFVASGCSQGHMLKLNPDTKTFSVAGIKANPEDPFYAAMLNAYEVCGGKKKDEDMVEIHFNTSYLLPDWSEEDGWHYLDVECLEPNQD